MDEPTEQQPRKNRVTRQTDAVWTAAQDVARARGETLTQVIERALVRYAKRHGHNGG